MELHHKKQGKLLKKAEEVRQDMIKFQKEAKKNTAMG